MLRRRAPSAASRPFSRRLPDAHRAAATHGAANRELQGLRAAAGALAPSAWAITCGCYLAVGLACALWPRKAAKAA
ncbi:MAG: hypothetical protein HYZ53_16755 [Planctomycetes bacterium]|nr:hypothetical protein [Planctomycetota bacterium]